MNTLIHLYNQCKLLNFKIYLILSLIFLYYIFGIYILIDDYNLFKILETNCGSKIWYYSLISLIGFTDKLLLLNIESIHSYYTIYLMLLIELLLVIFGGIQLWNNKCIYNYNFRYYKLYDFCIVNFSLQIIMCLFLIIKIIIMNLNRKNIIENINIENFIPTFKNEDKDEELYNEIFNPYNEEI